MISRSAPSYSPTERARSTALAPAWHCEQRDWGLGIRDWFCRAIGSPHLSQIGGVIGRIDLQHVLHTQPDKGSSRTASHTAQAGASAAARSAFAAIGIRDLGLGIRPRKGIGDLGLGIRNVTRVTRSRASAPPMTPPGHAAFFRSAPSEQRLSQVTDQPRASCDELLQRAFRLRHVNRGNTTGDLGKLSSVGGSLRRCSKESKYLRQSVGWRIDLCHARF